MSTLGDDLRLVALDKPRGTQDRLYALANRADELERQRDVAEEQVDRVRELAARFRRTAELDLSTAAGYRLSVKAGQIEEALDGTPPPEPHYLLWKDAE